MNLVFDACALIAYFRNEPGSDTVRELLREFPQTSLIHALNACEVYYDFLRTADAETAQSALKDITTIGLIIREDMDVRFWQQVAHHKATIRRISLADCFALTLAQVTGSELVTSDHKEFDPIVSRRICPIRFIR